MRLGFFALLLFAIGCSSNVAPPTFLQSIDTTPPPGVDFNPDEIFPSDELFVDPTPPFGGVQEFLNSSPYGTNQLSFLAFYQSNGRRASAAIEQAARAYRINPFVLLARAQMDGGLVGEAYYPSPPSRVEYVFKCGCSGDRCDPAFAGFDKQVDCLAAALRTNFDEIVARGATAGGWGPSVEQLTIDRQWIVPSNAATAALYQYEPLVGQGDKRGAWLFWVIFNHYVAQSSGGSGRLEIPWFGECAANNPCYAASGAKCIGGTMCTVMCGASGGCPLGTTCVAAGGYCGKTCNALSTASCPIGFACAKQAAGAACVSK